MTSAPLSHKLIANGLEHHLYEWAPPAGAEETGIALLLHGYMDAAGTWDLVAPELAAAGLRVMAPDMRGFGEGPRAPPGSYYYFPDYIADIAALIPMLPSAPLFLVGHSMGGTVASLYAGARPERVTKLALLEGVGPPDHPHEVVPDRMVRWLKDLDAQAARADADRSTFTKEDALRRLMMNHPRVALDVLKTRLPHLTYEVAGGRVAWRFDPLHKTTSPTPFFSASYVAYARRVTCPVLFVGGGPVGYHPPDEDLRLAAFARLWKEEIAEAGHMMHWTRPRETARLLVEFWRADS